MTTAFICRIIVILSVCRLNLGDGNTSRLSCPTGYDRFEQHCFYIGKFNETLVDAEMRCLNTAGNLIWIFDLEKSRLVNRYLQENKKNIAHAFQYGPLPQNISDIAWQGSDTKATVIINKIHKPPSFNHTIDGIKAKVTIARGGPKFKQPRLKAFTFCESEPKISKTEIDNYLPKATQNEMLKLSKRTKRSTRPHTKRRSTTRGRTPARRSGRRRQNQRKRGRTPARRSGRRSQRKRGRTPARRSGRRRQNQRKRGRTPARRSGRRSQSQRKRGRTPARRSGSRRQTQRKRGRTPARRSGRRRQNQRKRGRTSAKRSGKRRQNQRKKGRTPARRSGRRRQNLRKRGKTPARRSGRRRQNQRKTGRTSARRSGKRRQNLRKRGKTPARRSGRRRQNQRKRGRTPARRSGKRRQNQRKRGKTPARRSGKRRHNPRKTGRTSVRKSGRRQNLNKRGKGKSVKRRIPNRKNSRKVKRKQIPKRENKKPRKTTTFKKKPLYEKYNKGKQTSSRKTISTGSKSKQTRTLSTPIKITLYNDNKSKTNDKKGAKASNRKQDEELKLLHQILDLEKGKKQKVGKIKLNVKEKVNPIVITKNPKSTGKSESSKALETTQPVQVNENADISATTPSPQNGNDGFGLSNIIPKNSFLMSRGSPVVVYVDLTTLAVLLTAVFLLR